jgi:hypothetical protein
LGKIEKSFWRKSKFAISRKVATPSDPSQQQTNNKQNNISRITFPYCYYIELEENIINMTGHGSAHATRQEMADNLVPLHVRDNCAGILIPLNK